MAHPRRAGGIDSPRIVPRDSKWAASWQEIVTPCPRAVPPIAALQARPRTARSNPASRPGRGVRYSIGHSLHRRARPYTGARSGSPDSVRHNTDSLPRNWQPYLPKCAPCGILAACSYRCPYSGHRGIPSPPRSPHSRTGKTSTIADIGARAPPTCSPADPALPNGPCECPRTDRASM